jgi:hypothetical protein
VSGQAVEKEADPVLVHWVVEQSNLNLTKIAECKFLGIVEVSLQGGSLGEK